jgi:DASH complex subunit DAD3
MASSLSNSTALESNPYDGLPNLTELEAEVLWQYAKLAQNIKEVGTSPSRIGTMQSAYTAVVGGRNASVE